MNLGRVVDEYRNFLAARLVHGRGVTDLNQHINKHGLIRRPFQEEENAP